MRKIALAAIIAAMVVAPFASRADDIPDGDDCAATAAPGSLVTFAPDPNDPDNADRGAICVSDGNSANGAEVYVGGEAQAEEEGNPDAGGACGAIIVLGMPLSGDSNWDNPDPDGDPETDDGTHCD